MAWCCLGSQESFERLQGADEAGHWWCLPALAEAGCLVAMYCTAQASKPHQGVFAVFRVVGFDSARDSDCKRYVSSSGYGVTAFTKLALVQRVTPSLSSKAMRAAPLLGGDAVRSPQLPRHLLFTGCAGAKAPCQTGKDSQVSGPVIHKILWILQLIHWTTGPPSTGQQVPPDS